MSFLGDWYMTQLKHEVQTVFQHKSLQGMGKQQLSDYTILTDDLTVWESQEGAKEA